MSLKGPIFPKIKAALKSLIKDKTKEHTVKITPFGATKHLIVGKTDPLMLGINIGETQNGFIYIGEGLEAQFLFLLFIEHLLLVSLRLEFDTAAAGLRHSHVLILSSDGV